MPKVIYFKRLIKWKIVVNIDHKKEKDSINNIKNEMRYNYRCNGD